MEPGTWHLEPYGTYFPMIGRSRSRTWGGIALGALMIASLNA